MVKQYGMIFSQLFIHKVVLLLLLMANWHITKIFIILLIGMSIIAMMLLTLVAKSQPLGVKLGMTRAELKKPIMKYHGTNASDSNITFDNAKFLSIPGTLNVTLRTDTVYSIIFLFFQDNILQTRNTVFSNLTKQYGKADTVINGKEKNARWRMKNKSVVDFNFSSRTSLFFLYYHSL
jgi:hypothetical protein